MICLIEYIHQIDLRGMSCCCVLMFTQIETNHMNMFIGIYICTKNNKTMIIVPVEPQKEVTNRLLLCSVENLDIHASYTTTVLDSKICDICTCTSVPILTYCILHILFRTNSSRRISIHTYARSPCSPTAFITYKETGVTLSIENLNFN